MSPHVEPHEIPAGLLLIEPVPPPVVETLTASVLSVNVAVTDPACVIVTWHVPVPEHPIAAPVPDHPLKVDPVAGVAVRVTLVL